MVIQRWQSVLLLLASALMAFFTFSPLAQVQLPLNTLELTSLGFSAVGESTAGVPKGVLLHTWPFFTLSLMSAVLPFVNIFLFKNLRLQKNVCLIELLFIVGTVAVGSMAALRDFNFGDLDFNAISFAPLLAFVIVIMAYNRICRDQRALRSADRLR